MLRTMARRCLSESRKWFPTNTEADFASYPSSRSQEIWLEARRSTGSASSPKFSVSSGTKPRRAFIFIPR